MSAEKVETFAEVIAEMRIFKCRNLATGELEGCPTTRGYFADRAEAAHKRDVARLVGALKALAEDTCQHCDARYCQATCHNGEPQIPCRVVYEAQQIVREFTPEEPKQDADDDMPFGR